MKILVLSLGDGPREQNLSWRLAFRRFTKKCTRGGVGGGGRRERKERKGKGREVQSCLESGEAKAYVSQHRSIIGSKQPQEADDPR